MVRSRKVQVAMVQMACSADMEANKIRTIESVHQAANEGAQIICLQELFLSTYFCLTEEYAPFQWAESIPGPSTVLFQQLAKELKVVIIVPLFEKRAEGLYHNSAAIIDADGSLLGKYRKMHIPDDPSFYEKFYFTPGDLGFRSWKTKYGTIGVLICWDQWYPEAARLTALTGAEIIF
jgi:N-carbamoylputrescine amidase